MKLKKEIPNFNFQDNVLRTLIDQSIQNQHIKTSCDTNRVEFKNLTKSYLDSISKKLETTIGIRLIIFFNFRIEPNIQN